MQVSKDLISFVCDSSSSKQNKFLPGTKIPIFHPDYLKKHRPDYLLILPWNIADEIKKQLLFIKEKKQSF